MRHRRWVSAVVLGLSCSAVEPAFAQDLPTLSVADTAADEADVTIDFVVGLSAFVGGEVTVGYATSEGEADDEDFVTALGILTFASGTVKQTIRVSLIDDSLNELPETLDLTLFGPTGATIDDGVATGTIEDNDPEPELSTGDSFWYSIYAREGEDAEVSVYLSNPSGRTVTVDYATAPRETNVFLTNEAEAGSDYIHVAGTLTFDPGETAKTIAVTMPDDEVYEGTERFSMGFSNPEGATLFKPFWPVAGDDYIMFVNFYILENEPVPGVTIGDAADVESAGELAFPVTLTVPIEAAVSMTYSTADGTAAAGEDYTAATNATLSFGSGETSKTIRIAIADDSVTEVATETFSVDLTQTDEPLVDNVDDLEATGSIRDDDGAASLSVGDASASEVAATLSFRVTLGGQSSVSVTVDYATEDATATDGQDYTQAMGTLTFAPGDVRQTITVSLLDDDKHEVSETFSVSLSDAVGATLDDGTGTGTIHDNDGSPFMTIHGSEGPEHGLLDFVVTLSPVSGVIASADYVADEGFAARDPPAFHLADTGSDFVYDKGTLTFAPGETSKTIRVQVLEDLVDEPVEAVVITLDNPVNVRFEPRKGSDTCPWGACTNTACCDCGTILDDDLADLSISDASGPEDSVGKLEFEVTMSGASEVEVTVDYATSDGTAVAGSDYTATGGTLTFTVGQVAKTIEVPVLQDGRPEEDETLTLALSKAVNATIGDGSGTGIIRDDDPVPATLSIDDAKGSEGHKDLAFTVTLSGDPGANTTVTVGYATSDTTAVAGEDYQASAGVLTFAPGVSSRTLPVSLVDDGKDEPAETFAMTLSSATNATIDTGTAEGTIIDNDGAPQLSIAGAEGGEGDVLDFVVTVAGSSDRSATVSYATSDGTAVAGEDYRASAGVLTFAPGASSRTLPVSLVDDGKDEPAETFAMTLSSATNATIDTGTAEGTIIDNDGAPQLSIAGAEGGEGDVLDFVVTVAGSSDRSATVSYATSDGTAVAGEDYRASAGVLTFAPGASSRTLPVSLVDDGKDEPAETFAMTLSSATNATIDTGTAEGTIIDNDGAPQLSIAGAEGGEGDVLDFVVTVAGSSDRSATVSYATSDGTAVAGEDYRASAGVLTFAPGASSRTLPVSLVDDGKDEPAETFAMTLSSATNATIDTGTAEGTIIDNDGAPQLSIAGAEGGEGDVLDFVVTVAGSSDRSATVSYATSDGTAVAGEDYRASAGVLTFAPGASSRTLPVSLVDDGKDEPAETFAMTLSSATNATIDTGTAEGTIIDNDGAPQLSIAGAEGGEGDVLDFVVTVAGSSDRSATVSYATSDGTAVAGEDYRASAGVLTFAPGTSSRTLPVSLVDDGKDEPAETFAMTLSSATNATIDTGTADGTIIDNDGAPQLSIAGAEGGEGDVLDFVVTVAGSSDRSATVSYATSDGTAVAGEDYRASAGVLTFAPGASSRTLPVSLVDDGKDEPAETFAMTLSSATNATIDTGTADGTIIDNDGAPQLSIAGAEGGEGDVLDFVVTVAGSSDRSATVSYATSDGTAVAGEDYRASAGVLTFAPGGSSRTLPVSLVDDGKDEPAETFAMTLSSATNATIDIGTADGTIIDNDGAPQLSIAGAEGGEGDVLDFVVTVAGSSDRSATVSYATSDGTAVAGEDYRASAGVLTFAPGASSRTLPVSLVDDGKDEPAETFAMTLSSATNATIDTGTAEGTIIDNDGAPQLSIAGAEGGEGDVLDFVVTVAGSSDRSATVSYATSDGTAVAGEDYRASAGVLTFAPGASSRTLPVSLVDDGKDEPVETFAMTLSSATNATIDTGTADGTIIDNDGAPHLYIAGAEGGEGDVLDFVVTVAGSSDRSATVSYATSDGTAVAGEDYRASAGVLTFAPGASSRTLSVSLIDDAVHEPTETFRVTLSSPENADIALDHAVGRIVDGDEMPTLSVAGGAGREGAVAEFVVTLAGSGSEPARVGYATTDGTAVAGEDYLATEGTLTFAPGESNQTLSVSLLDDAVYEPEENFRLELSSPTNATLGVSAATGTIIDDDRAGKAPTKGRVLVFESAANPDRQGFVRIINHSAEAGEVLIEAIDDSGMRLGPVPLAIGAGAAAHFNSDDLEAGNASKGLPDGVGPPSVGIWRLELSSVLDIEVLSYARTSDGFVTSLHDTAPATAGVHRAVFLNPGRNVDQVSRLRLVNPGSDDALVTITGTDDMGGMSVEVVVDVPAGTAREWTAAELESGAGTDGALGQGDGKWRLRISSDRPVLALSLIESPTGNLTNMSTLPRTPGRAEGSHAVPLFPSASEPTGRQGFVRVVNRAGEADEVRIEAFDNTVREYAPLALSVGADEVASFNSDDLELRNAAKGLTGSTGAGEGDWWLELSSEGDIEVLAYIRTTDGFLTSMHDLVPEAEGAYRVVFFNPAENVNQVSVLRLVNTDDADAQATITGVDDSGATPGTAIGVTVPAGSSRELTSAELESGEAEAIDSGALGDGHGKWRLRVASDQPILVMSLLENPTGHLTNLSTATDRDTVTE